MIDYQLLRAELTPRPFAQVDWVDSTGSTNADLLAAGPRDAVALLAGEQTAARGRLGRAWTSPAGEQLAASLSLVVPAADAGRLGTLPLAVGVGIVDAITAYLPQAGLKWPNDVLVSGRKLCGVLAEAAAVDGGFHVVVGFGLNTAMPAAHLPVPHATSLLVEGVEVDPTRLAVDVLTGVAERLAQWRAGDARLLADYRDACLTLGRHVRVDTPQGEVIGVAQAVADDGRIAIDGQWFSAGDVTHLRGWSQ
ncbi:biotin--[acetyl-CoA-carboxylase] ligase [Corynebacterium uterequi]|uniref:biotin--[acetyl-CoA-carboxylase] ligase n=1 Tax=Corynebacterium uterequi TaxID=1072256 RepID=UPI001EEDEF14|nr:biotin--[acetyl-CoA-carboxylase] ligase [Corynebacterium uterequi]